MDNSYKLSEHFTLGEFIYTETFLDNQPSKEIIKRLRHVAEMLENIRASYNKPIYINSGFRSIAVNKAVGGSPSSLHLTGHAVDISISNYTVYQLPGLFSAILATHPYEFYPISRYALHISWHPAGEHLDLAYDPYVD